MHKLLKILIFSTLAFLPSYLIRCKNFSWCVSPIPFTLLEALILATFCVWLYLEYKENANRTFLKNIFAGLIPRNYQILIALFLTASFIAALVSPDNVGGLGIYKAYFLEGFLFFVVTASYLKKTRDTRLIVTALACSGLLVGAAAFLEKVFAYSPTNLYEFTTRGRVGAFYSTSNAVGLLLVPIFFVVLGYVFSVPKNRVFYYVSLAFMAIGVWVSGSRGALFALGVGIAIFVLVLFGQKFKKAILNYFYQLMGLFLGLLVIFNLLFLANISYFKDINIQQNFYPELNQRFCLWEAGVNLVTHQPLFGAGLNGYNVVDDKYRTCSVEQLQYPHNLILNFWSETGILGLISFLLIILWLSLALFKKGSTYLSLGLATALFTIVVHGVLDVPFFKNDLSLVFWVIFALSLYQISLRADGDS